VSTSCPLAFIPYSGSESWTYLSTAHSCNQPATVWNHKFRHSQPAPSFGSARLR